MLPVIIEKEGQIVSRSQVQLIADQMRGLPQLDVEVVHHFGHKSYGREIHIPKGAALTGRIQKFSNINILSQGEMTVLTKSGRMERVKAPWTEITPAGTKRVGYAHEDSVWTTIFATEETDPDIIVNFFTTNDEQEYLAHQKKFIEEV